MQYINCITLLQKNIALFMKRDILGLKAIIMIAFKIRAIMVYANNMAYTTMVNNILFTTFHCSDIFI